MTDRTLRRSIVTGYWTVTLFFLLLAAGAAEVVYSSIRNGNQLLERDVQAEKAALDLSRDAAALLARMQALVASPEYQAATIADELADWRVRIERHLGALQGALPEADFQVAADALAAFEAETEHALALRAAAGTANLALLARSGDRLGFAASRIVEVISHRLEAGVHALHRTLERRIAALGVLVVTAFCGLGWIAVKLHVTVVDRLRALDDPIRRYPEDGAPVFADHRPDEIGAVHATLRRVIDELGQERRRAEEVSAAKTRFIAAASHDLRQPLQALTLFVTALAPAGAWIPDTARRGRVEEVTQRMGQAVDRLNALLNALLDLSRFDNGQISATVEAFPINAVLDELANEYRERCLEKGIELRMVACGLRVESDRTLLHRILGNFLNNAVRYVESGRITVGCRRIGGNVRVCVGDTGPGIPADKLETIFLEFTRASSVDEAGLGLGLAIAKRVADRLGHRLVVQSKPGQGSLFAVDLPVAPPP